MPLAPFHALNWAAGWWLILSGFVVGAGLGLFFHRDDFWGGYDSFRRRIFRLGHIALEALGFSGVNDVRQGKYIELDLADGTSASDIDDMCRKLLANTVIENYRIETA